MRIDVAFGLVTLALVSGCTAHVHPKPDLRSIDGDKLPMRVAVIIPTTLTQRQDAVGKMEAVGGSWVFDTGEVVPPMIADAMKRVFGTSAVLTSSREVKDADVIVTVKSFALSRGSTRENDYSVKFDLHATVQKANGEEIFDEYYSEQVQGDAHSSDTALYVPADNALKTVMGKLASDLRTKVTVTPPVSAAVAEAPAAVPVPVPVPALAEPAAAAADAAPPPTPAPEPVAEPMKPAESFASAVGVSKAIALPSRRRPLPSIMLAAGAILFAGGYASGPAYLYGTNSPGDNTLSFIPGAGPLLTVLTNPFLSTRNDMLVYAIAATAAQGVGLVLALTGIATMGGGSSSSARAENSVLHTEAWALVPTVTPRGGVGVAFVAH